MGNRKLYKWGGVFIKKNKTQNQLPPLPIEIEKRKHNEYKKYYKVRDVGCQDGHVYAEGLKRRKNPLPESNAFTFKPEYETCTEKHSFDLCLWEIENFRIANWCQTGYREIEWGIGSGIKTCFIIDVFGNYVHTKLPDEDYVQQQEVFDNIARERKRMLHVLKEIK